MDPCSRMTYSSLKTIAHPTKKNMKVLDVKINWRMYNIYFVSMTDSVERLLYHWIAYRTMDQRVGIKAKIIFHIIVTHRC